MIASVGIIVVGGPARLPQDLVQLGMDGPARVPYVEPGVDLDATQRGSRHDVSEATRLTDAGCRWIMQRESA